MSKLTMRHKLGFGIGDLGGNLFFTIIGFYLLYFLTDILHLSAALAGTTLMVGKIWDAVTDPLTGYASDRTISRWGRRRPYMFTGALLSLVSMILLFSIQPDQSQMTLFFLATFYFCLLNTAYTLVNIPYTALLPELTSDYDERTVMTGYRMSFAVLGTFLGAAAVMPVIALFGDGREGWTSMSAVMGGIMTASALATVWAIREPDHRKAEKDEKGFFKTYWEVMGIRVFLLAVIPWSLFIMGTSMIQGALVYYFKYIYNNEGLFQLALVGLLSASLICIPVWVRFARRFSKKNCYIAGMLIMTAGVLLFALGDSLWSEMTAVLIVTAAGTGLSTHYVMPHSILPDVVEYDAVKNGGIRREGVFSSLWTFSSKIGQALALALNGWLLSLFHYVPDAEQTREALWGIRLICGPFPALFYITGVLILMHFPITREYYRKLMDSVE